MTETNQGGEFHWVLAGSDPKLPAPALVELDDKRRLLIPKAIRRRLPENLIAGAEAQDLLCELRVGPRLRLSTWAQRGPALEAEIQSPESSPEDRLRIRSKFQKVALGVDSRVLLPHLAVAHLSHEATDFLKLVGCFYDSHIEIMQFVDWQKSYLTGND